MDGWLMVCDNIGGDALAEAMSAYQGARKAHARLTLCGIGAGCAYALMLAQRFTVEQIWLAPFIASDRAEAQDTRKLKRAMRITHGELYAVYAPIILMLPECSNHAQRALSKRIFAGVISKEKQIITYKNADEARAALLNASERASVTKIFGRCVACEKT